MFFLKILFIWKFFNLSTYFWQHQVFIVVCGFSLVAVNGRLFSSCGAQTSHCCVFSCCEVQALGWMCSVVTSCGLQSVASVVVMHGLSCPAACGISPEQELNSHLLHWQAVFKPLDHQGSANGIYSNKSKDWLKIVIIKKKLSISFWVCQCEDPHRNFPQRKFYSKNQPFRS